MAILKVLTAPDPILKKRSLPVDYVDNSVRKIMDDMLETMYKKRGVGLAANQVGILKRILVVDLQDDEDQRRERGFYPLFLANPEITSFSEEVVEAEEGCLSLPETSVFVTRPKEVKVKYLDYDNNSRELSTGGWLARALQHEIDHLNGRLLINHLSEIKRSVVIRKLTKIKRLSV